MSAQGIIPDAGYGGLLVTTLPAPAGVTNAYVPPESFTVSSPLRFYGANCSANRFDPQQLNAFESEMLCLAATLNPNGTWNTGSTCNLANAFTAFAAALAGGGGSIVLATSVNYPGLHTSDTTAATPGYVSAAISAATTVIESLIPGRSGASAYPSLSDTTYSTPAYVTEALSALVFHLRDLGDVNVTEGSGIDGLFLKWNNGTSRWIAAAVSTITTLAGLSDVNVSEGSGINGHVLFWNNSVSRWQSEALATVSLSGAYSDLSGRPSLATVATTGAFADLTGKPTNATYALSGLSDVSVTEGPGIDGYVLKWNNGTGRWSASATGGITTLSSLTDVSVSEGPGIDGYVLYWNDGAARWQAKALAAVATTGAYSDLSGRPSLATVALSGAYSDLTGRPSLATVATTGAFADLTGKPTNATYALSGLSDVNVTEGAGIDGFVLKWNNGTSRWIASSTSSTTSLAALTDVNVTEGAGIDGLFLRWKNSTSKWVADAIKLSYDTDVFLSSLADGDLLTYNIGAAKWENTQPAPKALSGLSDVLLTSPANNEIIKFDFAAGKWKNAANTATFNLAIKNNGSTVESAATSVDFINATSITTASGAVVVTLPTGGGGGGGGAGGTMTPPTIAGLSAITNLGSATLTDRTTGVLIPALNIRPDTGASNSVLYCALEAAPVGHFTLTLRFLMTIWNISGGWYGGGLVLHNSGNGNNVYMMRLTATSPVVYLTKWTGGFSSVSFTGGQFLQDEEYFLHIDYDGTNYLFGASRNGTDKIQFFSEAVATFLGAITHVGIGWSGTYNSTNGPLFDFQHYHSGAAGSSGL